MRQPSDFEFCGHSAIVIDRDWLVWIVRLCAVGLLAVAVAFYIAACYTVRVARRL